MAKNKISSQDFLDLLEEESEPQSAAFHPSRPQVEPKLSQSKAKVEPNYALETLVGLQRQSLFFIYESCRVSGSKISGPIGIHSLAEFIRTTLAAARKALQRLEQKEFLVRIKYKDGRPRRRIDSQ